MTLDTIPAEAVTVYECPNGHRHYFVARHSGVIPDLVRCQEKDCKAMSQRIAIQTIVEQHKQPSHEWFRPRYADRIKTFNERNYVYNGGLLLRAVGEPDVTLTMKPAPKARSRKEGRFSKSMKTLLTNAKR